ncbi:FAD-binding oxidoreductase [Actinomadura sp. NBRC 104412]|uniref:FAD-binding oxidoreductase n=1 Tax=Actinomadura sp. NBRC 104412 TaxID=3032203 RepID=UPI002556EC35|nr:FAD-binding oxidoreductase [Actinomadura sp. NBRC 104412]
MSVKHELAGRTEGPVYVPGDDGYDEERTGFQLLGPHRPEVIVGAAGVADVRAAVEYAAARRVPLAVQAGGHGVGVPTRGVLVGTRRMNRVSVDPGARTAWVEAGATWAEVVAVTAPHGLAPLSGSFPGVGAVPYTLGGGSGLLARLYGFAADHVRRFEVVTMDGRLRRADETSEPELFWALRGGGGDFGVVTGMEIDLMPVEGLFGGSLFFDVARVPGVLDAWRRWTRTVPEEVTSAVSVLVYPDAPPFPEAMRGRQVAQLQIAFAGPEGKGRSLVEPLQAVGPVLRDTLRELPYTESGEVFQEPAQPHPYRSRCLLLSDVDGRALAALTKTTGPDAAVPTVVGLRHLGGALARPPRVPNAVDHRDAAYSVMVLSVPQPGQEKTVKALHREALAPFASRTVAPWLTFTYGPLGVDEVRAAFEPATYRRLAQVKARYDPHGLVHGNHPIAAA